MTECKQILKKLDELLKTSQIKNSIEATKQKLDEVKNEYEQLGGWKDYNNKLEKYFSDPQGEKDLEERLKSYGVEKDSLLGKVFENYVVDILVLTNNYEVNDSKIVKIKSKNYAYLLKEFDGIGDDITILRFSNIKLGEILKGKSVNEIENLFTRIKNKKNIKYLNLYWDNLRELSKEELGAIFSNLPEGLKYLDLSNNSLKDLAKEELEVIFKNLPEGLKYLYLNNNNLGSLGADGLEKLLSDLPEGLKSLKLSLNNLGSLGADGLEKLLSDLPEGLKSLDLSWNDLGSLGVDGLKEILSVLPKNLKSLDLSWNHISIKQGQELEKSIKKRCSDDIEIKWE